MSELAVEELAASVADGAAVDWDASQSRAVTERDRRVLTGLRLIAGISDFHRTQALEDAGEGVQHVETPSAARSQPSDRWGPFELVRLIGEGAFGDVYRARDALQRDVALKLLRPVTHASADQLAARILHEGRVLARVRHPSVVTVYGAEEHDGRVGLWMEFIEGRTLEELLVAQGQFGAREAALIGRELCRALAAVHGAGLVHRDIKAQNVMREAGGRLVLMDFGAGQMMDADVQRPVGRITGTPLYLAPELLDAGAATTRSDIYSLGVLLYHLVTGSYPIRATSLAELRTAHRLGQRRRLTDVRPDLPDEFVMVVERALDADPARRYESAGAMADALAQTLAADAWPAAAGGRSDVEARPEKAGAAAAAPVPWWRRPAVLFGAAAMLVLLTAGAVILSKLVPPRTDSGGPAPAQTLKTAVRSVGGDTVLSSLIADQIQQDLAASPRLRVIAASAVQALDDRPASALFTSLEADVVVEVTGQNEGGGAAASVQVARSRGAPVLIAGRAGSPGELRSLAQDLAERVVSALEVRDASWKPSPRTMLPLENPEAIRAFRMGQTALGRDGREDVLEAARRFREATMLAPDFVLAYAKWAEAVLSIYRHNALSAAEAFPVAQDAIAQALRRDEQSGEAHAALADLHVEKDRDWDRAEAAFRRALELSPSSEYARIRFAMMLAGQGRTEEAVSLSLEAQSLNPRSSALRGYAGAALHYAGRYAEAARMYESTLSLDSGYTAAWIGLCKAYTALREMDRAVEACETVRSTGAAESTFVESQLVQAYADAGRARDARRHLAALDALYERQPSGDTAFWLALAHASLGERDEAFRWLDEAIAKRSSRLLYARVDARLDPLRGDPRFAQRRERIEASYR